MNGHWCWPRLLLSLGLVLAVSACQTVTTSSPLTGTSELVASPAASPIPTLAVAWPSPDWPTSTPEEQGMDSNRLVEMLDFISDHGYPVHAIVVVRNGYLVLEAYYYPFRAGDRHYLASCTKSVVSALVGIAIQQGTIEGVDQKLLAVFSDRTVANLDARKETIRLKDLLTMTSGLSWPGTGLDETLIPRMIGTEDWVQFVLDRPMDDVPGTTFKYNSGGSHLLTATIHQTTGQTPLAFAQENLFTPLGITDVYWPDDPAGVNCGGGWLEMTPRDMARFGYLFLRKGEWAGQTIISPDWVHTSTTSHVDTGYRGDGYGYQWWVDPGRGYLARGYGGQRIHVVPDRQLVFVVVSDFNDQNMEEVPDKLLEDYILPAASTGHPLPANPDGVEELETRLSAAAGAAAKPIPDLPAMAKVVSGRTYALQPNRLGIKSFNLDFSGEPDEGAMVRVTYEKGPVEVRVGLDDTYRFTLLDSDGFPPGNVAAKGFWPDEDEFYLDYMQQGHTGYYLFRFKEQQVTARFLTPTGAETIYGIMEEP